MILAFVLLLLIVCTVLIYPLVTFLAVLIALKWLMIPAMVIAAIALAVVGYRNGWHRRRRGDDISDWEWRRRRESWSQEEKARMMPTLYGP